MYDILIKNPSHQLAIKSRLYATGRALIVLLVSCGPSTSPSQLSSLADASNHFSVDGLLQYLNRPNMPQRSTDASRSLGVLALYQTMLANTDDSQIAITDRELHGTKTLLLNSEALVASVAARHATLGALWDFEGTKMYGPWSRDDSNDVLTGIAAWFDRQSLPAGMPAPLTGGAISAERARENLFAMSFLANLRGADADFNLIEECACVGGGGAVGGGGGARGQLTPQTEQGRDASNELRGLSQEAGLPRPSPGSPDPAAGGSSSAGAQLGCGFGRCR